MILEVFSNLKDSMICTLAVFLTEAGWLLPDYEGSQGTLFSLLNVLRDRKSERIYVYAHVYIKYMHVDCVCISVYCMHRISCS